MRRMIKRPEFSAALLLVLLFICSCLTGCGGQNNTEDLSKKAEDQAEESPAADSVDENVEPGLVRIALEDPVPTMDVHKDCEFYSVAFNIYERLFEIRTNDDGTTRLENGLAEDWSLSEDGLTYHFTLRPDSFFSDGTPVSASDVAFSFTRMLALEDSVQSDFADMILGAEAVMEGKTDTLKGIRVLNDRELEITLSDPYAGYISMLATPSCSILSEKFVTEAGDAYGLSAEQTIGSGPYQVTEFTDTRITMEKNPYYHCQEGEELTVERAEFLVLAPALIDRTFREGGLDLLDLSFLNPDVVASVYKSDDWDDRRITRSCVEDQCMILNLEEPPLNDVRIRKAVQMAVNRQRILDEIYNGDGQLLDGIFPRGLMGYTEENQGWLTYDPEEAARLISEVPGAADARIELGANAESSVRKLRMVEMVRQDLEAVGLNVMTVSYDRDSRTYLRRAGKLMAYFTEWSADYNDPDNFIYTFFGSREKTVSWSSNYSDEAVMARIASARTLKDEEERMAEYADLEKTLIQDEAVWVPLFSTEHMYILGERVESFSPFWAGWSDIYLRDIVLKPEAR